MPLAFRQHIESWTGTRYAAIEHRGQGGNGAVHLMVAMNGPHKGVPFAVKFFRRGRTHPQWSINFFREVNVLRQCVHPSIVRVFDEGLYGDLPFFVMEFLPAELRRVMGEARPTSFKLSVAAQLLSGLDYLSRKDPPIVHRDIKPENIFLKGPTAILGDFGLLKFSDDGMNASAGSPSGAGMPRLYRTPEAVAYLRGAGPAPTPSSDIYQLGLVLAELFTGVSPQRTTRQITALIELDAVAPVPGPFGRQIADKLRTMLEDDPRQRPVASALVTDFTDMFLAAVQNENAQHVAPPAEQAPSRP